MDSESKKVAKAVLMSIAGMLWTGQPTAIEEQDFQDEQETTEQEQVEDQTGTDGDKLIIEAAQKIRTVVFAAASAAGGRVVDGKPEPGMAIVHVGATFFSSITNGRRLRSSSKIPSPGNDGIKQNCCEFRVTVRSR